MKRRKIFFASLLILGLLFAKQTTVLAADPLGCCTATNDFALMADICRNLAGAATRSECLSTTDNRQNCDGLCGFAATLVPGTRCATQSECSGTPATPPAASAPSIGTAYFGCKDGRLVYANTNQTQCQQTVAPNGVCDSMQITQAQAQALTNDLVAQILSEEATRKCAQVTQAPAASTAASPTPTATPAQLSGRVTLPNPLGTTSPEELIGRVIKALLSIVGSLALLMFIYGGILWLTAGGSSEGVKKGQEIIKWSVAGILLIFTAYIILRYVLGALQGTFTP